MLILLPPSETKAAGGAGPALDLNALSFPTLTPVRSAILDDLSSLEVDDALRVLGISGALRGEAEANRVLRDSATMPALERYTGVLYDALGAATLTLQDVNARSRLAVGSALFGVVRADDPIPRYRLSAGTKLPVRDAGAGAAVPTMKRRWGHLITQALQATPDGSGDGVIVDLRSGGYQALGKVPAWDAETGTGAVTVRVESVRPDGSRKVVSHFNKHYKGVLARALATAGADADAARTASDIATIAAASGLAVEINEPVGGQRSTTAKDTLTLVV
ncbi:peroxide stress protein YaaA [uncultured Corynebacterium sp.]|uniref:peroxide stress protein YaaA n=1 Tax=uncultured Corynebacterium sp. TaxID=159447 RepID=UPI0025CE6D49|nr:peroxide stress protein YaaA [uncultured Corynebacterium sp.]